MKLRFRELNFYNVNNGSVISINQLSNFKLREISPKLNWDTISYQYIPNLLDYGIANQVIKRNPDIERVWAMPNKNTFNIPPIRRLLEEEMQGGLMDYYIDLFANNSDYSFYEPGVLTNDLNLCFNTDYHEEAEILGKQFKDMVFAGAILDWPYSPRQIKECYENMGLQSMLKGGKKTNSSFWSKVKDEAARIIIPGGKVFTFGWNSNGLGKSRGFITKKILMVQHGGFHNDTIYTVEIKTA
jgi:hypothetical protein